MTQEPVYDPELALKLVGQQADLAKEMLEGLLNSLPDELKKMEEAFHRQDMNTLARVVHQLHGLACYCGVPRLKSAAAKLEVALGKAQRNEVTEKLADFFRESESLLVTLASEA